MKNWKMIFSIIVDILVLIGLVIGLGFSINSGSILNRQLISANSTIPYLFTRQANDQSLLNNSTATIQFLGQTNRQLDATLNYKSTQLIDFASTQISMINEISTLKEKAICSNSPSHIDFTSNATVSKDLISWLEDIDGSGLHATWEIIWNNSKTSIHKITGRYVWEFIVFFKSETNPNMNTMNAVFSIQDKCFLDD